MRAAAESFCGGSLSNCRSANGNDELYGGTGTNTFIGTVGDTIGSFTFDFDALINACH